MELMRRARETILEVDEQRACRSVGRSVDVSSSSLIIFRRLLHCLLSLKLMEGGELDSVDDDDDDGWSWRLWSLKWIVKWVA